ncbi:MAG: hypothetical protein NUV75_08630 [Gallionella sp.]|nr:hypothetical protein [Gallionella sp.]
MSPLTTHQPPQHLPAALSLFLPLLIYSINTKHSSRWFGGRVRALRKFACARQWLMRCRMVGERRIAKIIVPEVPESWPQNFYVDWRMSGFDTALHAVPVLLTDFGLCLTLGAGWGCSSSKRCFR